MPQGRPLPGEIYRHFKKKDYQIIAVATHSETREPYVVYQALYGEYLVYVRPYEMFIGLVDENKYPQVRQKYRFELVGSHNVIEPQINMENTKKPDENSDTNTETKFSTDGLHPGFLKFLDADSFSDKYRILSDMEEEMDDHLVNQMAASIDVTIEDGSIDERIMELKKCIRARAHFEVGRLR